ncbi:hypothetical protein Bca4012_042467 [Brassica carinata]
MVVFALVWTSLVSFSVLCPPLLNVSSLESFDLDLRSLVIGFRILVICVLASFVIGAFFCSVGNWESVFSSWSRNVRVLLDLFWSSKFLGDLCGGAFWHPNVNVNSLFLLTDCVSFLLSAGFRFSLGKAATISYRLFSSA